MARRFLSILLAASVFLSSAPLLPANETQTEQKIKTVISLDEALRLVKKNHPDIRLQEAAVQKASEEIRLAARAVLPDLDIDYIASSASAGWGFILTAAKFLRPVFSLKTHLTEKEVKKILKEKEESLLEHRKLEITQSVKELYAALLIERRLAGILEENAKRSGERLRLITVLHKAGRLKDEEFLKESSALETARAETVKAKTWLSQSEFAFRKLLGLSHNEPFSLEPLSFNEPQDFPLSLEECFAIAYAKNPIVKALLFEEKASLKKLGIKNPALDAQGAFLGLGESGGGLFSGSPRFGFTGDLTLYDWGKARLKKRILGLEDKELRLKHEKEFQAFETAIVKSYSELERLRSEISKSGAEYQVYRERKRRSELLAEMGRERHSELLHLKNEFAVREIDAWRSRLEYFLTRERLLKDLGLSSLDDLREAKVQ